MSRLRPLWPLLALALALLVLFSRLLLGEVFFWGLPSLQFTPWRETAIELLRGGQIPWWNSLSGAGAPLLANYQSALLYPPSWASLILATAWTMSVTAVLHLAVAGCGMWAFTGAIGANALGRGVSALAFGLTSYLVARTGTYPLVSAAVWLPWLLWAAHGLFAARVRLHSAWLGVFTALLLLAGHAQTAWYSLLLTGCYVAFLAVWRHRGWPLIWALAGVGVGGAVAALQLVPTAELLLSSQRGGGVEREFALNFSYAPARAFNWFAPNLFGTPADGSYFTEGVYFEDAVYIGVLPLIAALAAVFKWPWRRRARDPLVSFAAFFVVIFAVAFVLALGRYTGVFPFLYDHVPTFDLFQAPVRWHLWTVFAAAVLSAIGVTWWDRGGSWTRRSAAFCIAAFAVGIVGSFAMPDAEPTLQVLLRAISIFSGLALLAVTLTLTKPAAGSRWLTVWTVAALVVVGGDLVWANWGLNPTTAASFYDRQAPTTTARAFWPKEALDAVMFDQHLLLDDYRMTLQQIAAYRASGLPNLNLLDRADLFNNFDPLLMGSQAAYLDLLNKSANPVALYRAAGISAVYDAAGAVQPVRDAPLAWLTSAACWGSDAQVAARLAFPDTGWLFQPKVILAGEGSCSAATASSGRVMELSPDLSNVNVQVDVADGAWLVVARTWYPGWQAAVDGMQAPIERANLAFSAVRVPAGAHTVTFTYAPGWLPGAAALSVAGLAGLLVIFALARREAPYNARE